MIERMLRVLTRHAHRPVRILPVVACVPGVDVWFLRFAFAFLAHLRQGGHVVDRLNGQRIGDPTGPSFNFDHVSGGPLLWAPDLQPSRHLFIGHTVCPGFGRISSQFDWWAGTPFPAAGYDYLHDGMNYGHVPVDLAPHAYVSVSVDDVDEAAWTDPRERVVFVYCDPIEHAIGCFASERTPGRRAHGQPAGPSLIDWTFHEYLLKRALPAYAKMFVSYQAMAEAVPGAVHIVAESALRADPGINLSSLLSHLTLDRWQTAEIDAVADLCRREHVLAIEREVGLSLAGSRGRRTKPAEVVHEAAAKGARDQGLRLEALSALASMGVNTAFFEEPPAAASPREDAVAAGPV